jgi:hypothetical protein
MAFSPRRHWSLLIYPKRDNFTFCMGRKPLTSQLKEKPLNAEQIDALLERERAKAAKYASKPKRFMLFSLELQMKFPRGGRLVIYTEGQWSCNCPFFEDWGRCAHTMATALLLKDSLLGTRGAPDGE